MKNKIWKPSVFICITAFTASVLLQPGGLGIDTERRLQVAHSWWTDSAPIDPEVWPEFGVKGKDGTVHPQYGIGQGLVLFPADIVASAIVGLTNLSEETSQKAKAAIVGYMVFPAISTMAVLMCYLLLLSIGFSESQSLPGAMGLLFCTSFFHYTQHNQENSMLLLLLLCGFYFTAKWLQSGSTKCLILSALFPGYSVLTRLPGVFDFAAIALYAFIVIAYKLSKRHISRTRAFGDIRSIVLVFGCVFLFFFLCDRLYQWYRFGSFTTSYWHLHAEEARALDPGLPKTFPFTTPFLSGFLGALFSARRSVFLFNPLLVLTICYGFYLRPKLGVHLKAIIISALVLMLILVSFYATYQIWSGSNAWGDRYAAVPVELAAMFAVAIAAKYRKTMTRVAKALSFFLLPLSLLIQLLSSVFTHNLEEAQKFSLDFEFVIGLRIANLIAVLSGKESEWGLDCVQDWRRLTRLNFMPFKLGEFVSSSIAAFGIVLWLVVLVLLIGYMLAFARMNRDSKTAQ